MSALISEIKTTKQGRYALFSSDGFLFSIDEDTLVRNHVAIGAELSDTELDRLLVESDLAKARDKACDLLSYRDHSARELVDKLMRKFDRDTAESAVERLTELGLVNDAEFARKYAAELSETKGESARSVARRLFEKGIDRDTVEETLAELPLDEGAKLDLIIEKKYTGKLGTQKGRDSVFSALQRRGFLCSDIRAALCRASDGENDDGYGDF